MQKHFRGYPTGCKLARPPAHHPPAQHSHTPPIATARGSTSPLASRWNRGGWRASAAGGVNHNPDCFQSRPRETESDGIHCMMTQTQYALASKKLRAQRPSHPPPNLKRPLFEHLLTQGKKESAPQENRKVGIFSGSK